MHFWHFVSGCHFLPDFPKTEAKKSYDLFFMIPPYCITLFITICDSLISKTHAVFTGDATVFVDYERGAFFGILFQVVIFARFPKNGSEKNL